MQLRFMHSYRQVHNDKNGVDMQRSSIDNVLLSRIRRPITSFWVRGEYSSGIR